MERPSDNARALALSLGVHLLIVVVLFAGMLFSPLKVPLSVAGSPIEAVLVSAPANFRPAAPEPAEPARAPPPQPRPEPKPQQAEQPPQPQPQTPPPRPDTRETERAAQLALQQAQEKAQQEDRERRRQEQIELEAEKQREETERRERLRKEQAARDRELAEIREKLDAAKRARQREADKLAQLEDRTRPATPAAQPSEAPPATQLGNQGRDDSALGRYQLAIQQAVTQNWLRPDSTRPGLRCFLRIVQIPGGEVIQVSVSTPCNADDLTRRSIEAAVLKAQPLPYRGYESVFQREIRFNFQYDGE
jgi:colicin import membrane protein